MKKIKDFIHDSNDILLALFIIVIATGVIFWRMNSILDYPAQIAAQNAAAEATQTTETTEDKSATDKDDSKDEAKSSEKDKDNAVG